MMMIEDGKGGKKGKKKASDQKERIHFSQMLAVQYKIIIYFYVLLPHSIRFQVRQLNHPS